MSKKFSISLEPEIQAAFEKYLAQKKSEIPGFSQNQAVNLLLKKSLVEATA